MSEQEQIRSTIEIMVHWLSQHVRDGAVIHIGAYTPLALASALLAKLTHAPNAALDSPATLNAHVPYSIPITLRLLEGSQCSQAMQTHRQVVHIEGPDGCDFEPIAAAQIDRFGNINNSVIGSFDEPKIRLPGPAGIDTLTSMLTRTVSLYTTRHTPRTFVSDVDVVTGLGHRRHGKTRADLGYPEEGGAPQQVITNLGILDFGGPDRHMRLTHVHPGVTVEQVQAATGFELPVSPDLGETEAPDEEIRRLIWQEIDPMDTLMLEFEAQRDRLPNLRRLLDLERQRYMGVPWRWPRLESGTASA